DRTNLVGETVYDPVSLNGDCAWPKQCVARVDHPLVSSHEEGFYTSAARDNVQWTHRVSYKYKGAHADMGGFGWLGFDQRTVRVQDADAQDIKTTDLFYQPAEDWVVGKSRVPYTVPLAGLVNRTIERLPHATSDLSTAFSDSHLEVETA